MKKIHWKSILASWWSLRNWFVVASCIAMEISSCWILRYFSWSYTNIWPLSSQTAMTNLPASCRKKIWRWGLQENIQTDRYRYRYLDSSDSLSSPDNYSNVFIRRTCLPRRWAAPGNKYVFYLFIFNETDLVMNKLWAVSCSLSQLVSLITFSAVSLIWLMSEIFRSQTQAGAG